MLDENTDFETLLVKAEGYDLADDSTEAWAMALRRIVAGEPLFLLVEDDRVRLRRVLGKEEPSALPLYTTRVAHALMEDSEREFRLMEMPLSKLAAIVAEEDTITDVVINPSIHDFFITGDNVVGLALFQSGDDEVASPSGNEPLATREPRSAPRRLIDALLVAAHNQPEVEAVWLREFDFEGGTRFLVLAKADVELTEMAKLLARMSKGLQGLQLRHSLDLRPAVGALADGVIAEAEPIYRRP